METKSTIFLKTTKNYFFLPSVMFFIVNSCFHLIVFVYLCLLLNTNTKHITSTYLFTGHCIVALNKLRLEMCLLLLFIYWNTIGFFSKLLPPTHGVWWTVMFSVCWSTGGNPSQGPRGSPHPDLGPWGYPPHRTRHQTGDTPQPEHCEWYSMGGTPLAVFLVFRPSPFDRVFPILC